MLRGAPRKGLGVRHSRKATARMPIHGAALRVGEANLACDRGAATGQGSEMCRCGLPLTERQSQSTFDTVAWAKPLQHPCLTPAY